MLGYKQDKDYGSTAEEILEGKRKFICEQYDAFAVMFDKKREEFSQKQLEVSLYARALADIVREDMGANQALNVFAGYDAATDFDNAALLTNKDIFKKFSPEEQNKCRESYERIKATVNKFIFKDNKDFTMKDVLRVDGDSSSYIVQLEYKDQVLAIKFPIFASANADNFNSIVSGYMLSVPSSSEKNKFNILTMTLNYKVLADAYLKWYEDTFVSPNKNMGTADPVIPQKDPAQKPNKKSKAN